MRRTFAALVAGAAVLLGLPSVASADHPGPAFAPGVPASTAVNSGGEEGVDWELVTSFPTGNPHSDLDFFTVDGEMYVSVGTIAGGANAGGQTILKLTEGGEVDPSFVASHPSASCVTDPASALGLQHDVEATPKGGAPLNTGWGDLAVREDTQLLIDATDAPGRCHDNGFTGSGEIDAPLGGLEIIDVTDPENPVEIGLTSHIGEAHTVNVDPSRPHIAYVVSSDAVTVAVDDTDADGDGDTEELIRENEDPADSDRFDLDGWEIVDLSSCMDFPEGTSVEDKRAACQPEVYRFRYPSVDVALGHTNLASIYGCHELEVYPEDRLTCAGGSSMTLWDISGLFDDNGTPDDRTDDRVNGDPLPCRPRESSSGPDRHTDATVIDCVTGGTDEEEIDLTIPNWLSIGAPSVEGIEHVGTAYHMGRESATGAFTPAYDSTEDIDFDHEAEFTHSRRFVLATDERGGGVLPPGASCSPGIDNPVGNGGVHAYRTDALLAERPVPVTTAGEASQFDAELAWESYALNPEGEKAIFRAPIQTTPQASICTAHVFQQIPGQNRIFMGWYSQGTRVLDYVEHPDGTFEFHQVGYFIPENADQWVSHVFDAKENDDGSWTYTGVAGDFNLTGGGRNAIDIYRVTMPPPRQFAADVTGPEVERIAGDGAIGTAVAVSEATHAGGAEAVVLGRIDVYADNLAGGPLATSLDAPLLYTPTDALAPATRAEIERLGAQRVVVLGGTAAISEAVAEELGAMGVEVDRVAGLNRFDTARLIAGRLGSASGSVFVAEGEHVDPARGFPDPIAVGAYAGSRGDPILLVNRDRLPQETVAALDAVEAREAVVVGGTAAVSDQVEQAVAGEGVTTRRLAGETRYQTSLAVLRESLETGAAEPDVLWLATGQDWTDALAAAPAAARAGDAFATIDGQGGADEREAVLAEVIADLRLVRLVGDESSITPAVEADIRARVAPSDGDVTTGGGGAAQMASVVPAGDVALGASALVLLGAAAIVRRRRAPARIE